MAVKIPQRVKRCTTHHCCDCRQWRLEQMQTALRVIRTWAKCSALEAQHVIELVDETLRDPETDRPMAEAVDVDAEEAADLRW